MTSPEPKPHPLRQVLGVKPWILDRIVNPPSRHSLPIHTPPLIPPFFTRSLSLRLPVLLLVVCMLLFMWQTNAFGLGVVNDNSASCPIPSPPAGVEAGISPAPRPTIALPAVATRATVTPTLVAKPTATRVPDLNVPGDRYQVKSGDSLWAIATQYRVTVDELKAANNLSSNLLHVGDQLIIPKTH